MSNRLAMNARPSNGWSEPVDSPAVRALHHTYARFCGHVDMAQMRAYFAAAGDYLHPFYVPMTDGYAPFIGGVFQAERGGKVAVVFPYFRDDDADDHTTTDRCVSVHTIGIVGPDLVDDIVERLTAVMPDMRPPSPPDLEEELVVGCA